MRRRLLISLIVVMTASLGAECSGSSSSDSSATESSEREVQTTPRPATPTPEPSAALVFGAGLLTAYLVTRRKQS